MRLATVLFGIGTRRAFVNHLGAIASVMFILLMVAWTIDLANRAAELSRVAAERGVPVSSVALPYLGQRAVDIITRLLPMACFFGAFVAEIRRRMNLEIVIFASAGGSTLRLLAGALWLGLVLGALQTALEAKWRPAAVWAQVESGIGDYADRFGPRLITPPQWFISDDVAIRGAVLRGPSPELRDVLIFEGVQSAQLTQVLSATRMRPGDGTFTWELDNVARWQDGAMQGPPNETLRIEADMIPEMLRFYRVLEFNLASEDLFAFRVLPDEALPPGVGVAVWRRWTAWTLPLGLVVMGATLARAGFDGRRPVVPRLIGLAAVGYILVVSIKVFWEIGELGYMPAPLAATAGAGLCLLAAISVSRWRSL